MRSLFLLPVLLCGGLHLAACDEGKSKKKKDKDDDEDKTEKSSQDDAKTDVDLEDTGRAARGDERGSDAGRTTDDSRDAAGSGARTRRSSSGSFSIDGERCHDGIDITRVEVSERETTVYFEMDPSIDSYYIHGPGQTYAFQITDRDARVEGVYRLTDVRGVQATREGSPVMLDASRGDSSFRLVFEPLPRSVSRIYLTEGSDWDNRRDPENTWRCDDVTLR